MALNSHFNQTVIYDVPMATQGAARMIWAHGTDVELTQDTSPTQAVEANIQLDTFKI